MPAPLPYLAKQYFVTAYLLSGTWESETSKGIEVDSALSSVDVNQFCFEIGCLVDHFNMLHADSFKLRTLLLA